MRTSFNFLMLICCMASLTNCGDDGCDKSIIHPFPGGRDYIGDDTLTFLNNNNDTQVFIGQGFERFYVKEGKRDEYDCADEYESERLRFVDTKTQDEIISEFIYAPKSNVSRYGRRFYYKNKLIADEEVSKTLLTLEINGDIYNRVSIYSQSPDTLAYVIFNHTSLGSVNHGIIKIKSSDEILTLIQ